MHELKISELQRIKNNLNSRMCLMHKLEQLVHNSFKKLPMSS